MAKNAQIPDPPAEALAWIADAVGADTTIESVRALAGGTSTHMHAVETVRRGRRLRLVIRRFLNTEWLRERPDLVLRTASNLRLAARADVPTPELIALDETGEACDVPAVLATHLPGRVVLEPDDMDRWLRGLAEAAVAVHAVDPGDHRWTYFNYNDVACLQVPDWSRVPRLWERAIEIVNDPWPDSPVRFIHRDHHQANVLWDGGRVSGVVDWVNACRGPASFDLAHCRWNLSGLHGVEAADGLLDAYESITGGRGEYDPFWDLMALIECLPGPLDVYDGWTALGVRGLTPALLMQRADDYLTSVLARM
jgi:Ser/Thr protein kinase RdoA (MazF antagonist)